MRLQPNTKKKSKRYPKHLKTNMVSTQLTNQGVYKQMETIQQQLKKRDFITLIAMSSVVINQLVASLWFLYRDIHLSKSILEKPLVINVLELIANFSMVVLLTFVVYYLHLENKNTLSNELDALEFKYKNYGSIFSENKSNRYLQLSFATIFTSLINKTYEHSLYQSLKQFQTQNDPKQLVSQTVIAISTILLIIPMGALVTTFFINRKLKNQIEQEF